MKKEKKLPSQTIKGLIGLGEILRKIHNRIISEGYVMKDGKLINPEGEIIYLKSNKIF